MNRVIIYVKILKEKTNNFSLKLPKQKKSLLFALEISVLCFTIFLCRINIPNPAHAHTWRKKDDNFAI